MKVAKLIEELKKCPPEATVLRPYEGGINANDARRPVPILKVKNMEKHWDYNVEGPLVWLE